MDSFKPGTLSTIAAYVDSEYGSSGYRIMPLAAGRHVASFQVMHSDGSRFEVMADEWGNAETLPDLAVARMEARDAFVANANAV